VEALLARYRNVTILTVVILAQVLLLGYQVRGDKDVRLVRLWAVAAITPVARVLHGAHDLAAGFWNNYIGLRGAREESAELRRERDRLKLENQAMRQALGSAERLAAFTAYQQAIMSTTLLAEVIGAGANPNSRVVFVDQGSGAGVRAGMAVITPEGIAGKVQAVFPGASLVLLISDMYSAVGVILENSRSHGVLKGTGLNEARIDYVPNDEKVAVGEKVYTAGTDRVFPKGLLVGTVHATEAGRDFQQITVYPGVRLNRLEEVLIVTDGRHQDLPGDLPRPQAPEALLPRPPAGGGRDVLSVVPAEQGSGAAESYTPQTDADRLKRRYQELGDAQKHRFGEGAPGSKPPDFNQGWSPPARRSAPGAGESPRPAPKP